MYILMQALYERLRKSDNVAQGTKKDSVYHKQSSINKHTLGGIDSNNGGNQGFFPAGVQIPKIDMRKFENNDPMTWTF